MLDETQENSIEEELSKCSRCGLCLENCPIYGIKKDENNTSRGLICKLSGYKKGVLTEREVKKGLKICLNCTKCKSGCPSLVDTTSVFAYKNAMLNPSLFSQRVFLILKLLPLKLIYIFNFFKPKPKTKKSDILYFKGCVAKAQHKKTYLDKIFFNPEFSCCGLPYLTSGDIKNYKKAKEKNISLINSAKLVIFDCASCKKAVEEYSNTDKNKLLFFNDLIENKIKIKDNSKYKNKTITLHKPCHMDENEFLKTEEFLKNKKGINYKRLENYSDCCGFGGSYFIFHPVISTKIALKKAKNIKITNPDLILTICPSCTLGLRFNQLISFNFKKTLELRDFIDKETEICG